MQDDGDKFDYSLHYNRWHQDTDEHFAAQAAFYRRLLAPVLARVPLQAKILDYGCGQGLLVNALDVLGYRDVKGFDISAKQIQVAKRRGLNCDLVAADDAPDASEAAKERYDVVFLLDVLEHIPPNRQMSFVKRLGDRLVPGGTLVLSVPNANSTFATRWRYIDWTHTVSFTEHSIEFVLLNCGFSDVVYHPYEFMIAPKYLFIPSYVVLKWLLHRMVRAFRRLEAVLEMGTEGRTIPLSLNLLLACTRDDANV